jgi:hypothetical protein
VSTTRDKLAHAMGRPCFTLTAASSINASCKRKVGAHALDGANRSADGSPAASTAAARAFRDSIPTEWLRVDPRARLCFPCARSRAPA